MSTSCSAIMRRRHRIAEGGCPALRFALLERIRKVPLSIKPPGPSYFIGLLETPGGQFGNL
jgi:hypothetical protein